ncbi:MAG: SDR family NAD(P)-dependent oxidoreductase [Sphingomonadales bacterium]|nr:SDR family NAD(P)-dependent oxidoreductase [Sphingomonadales bacterium]
MRGRSVLRGRNILLTGASSGVGRHLAIMLAAQGASMICCARRASDLASLVAQIEDAGGKAVAQVCDVTDAASIVADWFATDAGKAQVGTLPRKRLMPVADLDPAVLFLLSAQSRSVSGSELTVDDTQSLA